MPSIILMINHSEKESIFTSKTFTLYLLAQ
jgi:hypothetical protein